MYTVGCYCALVILYFIPFLSVFYFYILSILAPPASAYCFLFLSVNQAARGARDDTLFLYSRSAPFRGTERPADSRTKNHNRRSRGEIHGGLLTSREGDLRVSMQIPVVAPWRGGRRWRRRREEGRSGWHEQDEAREIEKTTEILTDSLPWFPGVLPRTTNERRSTFFYPSLLFGDARSLRRYTFSCVKLGPLLLKIQ